MTSRTRETRRIDSPGFLDLDMPHQLFNVLERAFNRYRDAKAKKIDDALLLVLGLAMLREWIAPGYTGGTPQNPAERFSEALYARPGYKTLKHLANHAKHQFRDEDLVIRSVHYTLVDDWPDFDAANSVDEGPVKDYFLGPDNTNLLVLFAEVLGFYKERWFSLSVDEQMGSREERIRNVMEDQNDGFHQ